MSIELIALAASGLIGAFGWCIRRVDANEKRLDHIELMICREYTNKQDLTREFDRIYEVWTREADRINTKLEGHTHD